MSQHSPNWMLSKWRNGIFVNAELDGHLDHLDHLDPDISPSPHIPNTTGGASWIHLDSPGPSRKKGSTWEHHFRHQRFFHAALFFSHWKNISYDCEEVSIITIRYPYIKTLPQWFSGKLWGPRCHKWWLGLRKSSPKMELTYLTFLIQEEIFKTFLPDFPFFS